MEIERKKERLLEGVVKVLDNARSTGLPAFLSRNLRTHQPPLMCLLMA